MRDKKMKKFTSMKEQTTKKAPARAAGLCQLSLFDQTSTTPLSYTAAGTPVRPSAAHTVCSGTARIS